MFLRENKRVKDGKVHRYWSVVETVRSNSGVFQRQVLYLGEINDSQQAQWCRALEVLDESDHSMVQMTLFPEDRMPPAEVLNPVRLRLDQMTLEHPRQWGACWLAMELWKQVELDSFWIPRLLESRKGTDWLSVLKTLVTYRLVDPGSEWRLHRQWFANSAMRDLLGAGNFLGSKDMLYRCLDKLCEHKEALFGFLKKRWTTMFKNGSSSLISAFQKKT